MFWGGVGGVLVFVTAELKTGVADGNLRPHLGKKKKKRRPIWAVCTKSGQNCSRIGPKKFNHAGRTGEHKQRELPSRRQSLRVATGSLEENVLSLLQY